MIITIVNLKGGVGKTTTAICLASLATKDNKKVKVLDCDPQASASLWAMCANDTDNSLDFEVLSANSVTLRQLAKQNTKDEFIFIDCPPHGNIVDDAVKIADFVIIPSTTGAADITKTFETVETLNVQNIAHAVLLTNRLPNTVALRESRQDLEKNNISCFENYIPHREALKNYFGNNLNNNFYGYEAVYKELLEGIK